MMDTNGIAMWDSATGGKRQGPVYGSLGKCSHDGPIPLEFFLPTILTQQFGKPNAPRRSKGSGE